MHDTGPFVKLGFNSELIRMFLCCRSFLTLSDTYVVMPIVVHEFVKEAVPEEELKRPQQLERRACLFRQRIPPDQLNPQVPSLWNSA